MDLSTLIVGVDEAGRGPLAGPVLAAAVAVVRDQVIIGVTDSKKLTEKRREALFPIIQEQAVSYGIGQASPEEIDQLNILQATFLAMRRAVEALSFVPEEVLVDGSMLPPWSYPSQAIVKGDQKVMAIGAASILAKVTRDRLMLRYAEDYPLYEFASHKGYPTARHRALLQEHGPCPIHRCSFSPVRAVMRDG